ncbi:MAG: hypothetical protein DRQ89_01995 [Epsilonproteobacteria bacterium]|nr:MAG: hypothetical protein DRQ89_01995 [Campylobacterota bacterium]
MRRSHKDELIKVREENQRAAKSVKRDYYLQLNGLKERQENKVKKFQGKIQKQVITEKQAAKTTLSDLRKTHADQIERLRTNQEAQLQQLRNEHQIQLDKTVRKYKIERAKFGPATASEER